MIQARVIDNVETLAEKPQGSSRTGERSTEFVPIPLRTRWRIKRVQVPSASAAFTPTPTPSASRDFLLSAQAWWSDPQDLLTEENLQIALHHWGPWVAQLLDTFPVLAYLVLHPGTEPLGVTSNQRKGWEFLRLRILRETSEGAKLKEVGRLAGIPWCWRKFSLVVAPLVLRDPLPYTDQLIDAWLPESSAAQHTWVLAMRFLHRDPSRIHLEQAFDFRLLTDWIARHAGTPEFERHIIKRNNPKRLTRRFWIPIREWLIAQCDPTHPWHNPELPRLNARMSCGELATAVKRWQGWVKTTHLSKARQTGRIPLRPILPRTSVGELGLLRNPTLIPGMVFRDGWTIIAITKSKDLANEGGALRHCVGKFAKQLKQGTKFFFSLRDAENRPQITIELGSNNRDQAVKIVAASGLRNRKPTAEEWHRLQLWEETLNTRDPGRPVFFLEGGRRPT